VYAGDLKQDPHITVHISTSVNYRDSVGLRKYQKIGETVGSVVGQ
jgi:hypothetical protein